MAARIVLTTIGSLGDMHPFLAIGKALKARGAEPVMAVPEAGVTKAEAAGLEAVPVLPSLDTIARDAGMSPEAFTRLSIRNPAAMAKNLLVSGFGDSFERLAAAAEKADLIAGSAYMFAGAALAEKRGLPYANMVLQPLAFLSNYDPPYLWEYPVLIRAPKADWQLAWNRLASFVLHVEMRRRYGFAINRVRKGKGLPAIWNTPIFRPPPNSIVSIGMYSPLLGAKQPDFPPNTHLVGFPLFDSDSGQDETLAEDIQAFLESGPPPIVFTLGSFATLAPGAFYAQSREAARWLGRRSLLITGGDTSLAAEDCCCVRYVPHSMVFPRAAAIVHHGGVGTTGQALRSGRPQLVVPYLGDQPDNAARITRLGVGLSLKHSRYSVARATEVLGRLLGEPGFAERAASAGETVRAETAAETAADILIETAEGRHRAA